MKFRNILLIGIIAFLSFFILSDTSLIKSSILSLREQMGIYSIALLTLTYAILLSIPFVAGVEIGLALMAVFGDIGIIAAYFGTISGLSISFLYGKYIFKTSKGSEMQKLTNEVSAFSYFVPRWISLPILINMPGNSLVGGGGGIAFLFGLEREISYLNFLVIISLCTLPIPLLFYSGLFLTRH